MIREIRLWPSPVLAEKAAPVATYGEGSVSSQDLYELAYDMLQTMRAAGGVGLAAPQVGVPLRVIAMTTTADFEIVMVNPEIVEASPVMADSIAEGCLSLPGVRENVTRPEKVRVRYLDPSRNPMIVDFEGRDAVVVQHEIDHLDGLVIFDRLEAARKKKATREYQRKNGRK